MMVANTMFQPKNNSSVHTLLQTKAKGRDNSRINDFGPHVNSAVKAKYKKIIIKRQADP